jgi:hypothetical protein
MGGALNGGPVLGRARMLGTFVLGWEPHAFNRLSPQHVRLTSSTCPVCSIVHQLHVRRLWRAHARLSKLA